MKYIQTLITMLVGGVVLALGSSAVAQTVKPCMVTVVRIQGEARYSLGDNVWHPLLVGKILGVRRHHSDAAEFDRGHRV